MQPWQSTRHMHRRAFLADVGMGFTGLALGAMLQRDGYGSERPWSPPDGRPHFTPKAKSVIFLFMAGGPSHMETFDPKPLLNKLDGEKKPEEFGEAKYQFVRPNARLLGSKRKFSKHGQSGIEVSDLFPHTAQCIDDIAVIRSCYGDKVVHSAAQYELFSGRTVPGFPSMGSWAVYGLGSESESLPSYVVMPDPDGALEAGQPMYMNGFLPAAYQPTLFRPGANPVRNLDLPSGISLDRRRKTVELIRQLNEALPLALDAMTRESEGLHSPVAPVDLSQAIIGPGIGLALLILGFIIGVSWLGFAPAAVLAQNTPSVYAMGISMRAARIPGTNSLALAALYTFGSLAVLIGAARPLGLLDVNPGAAQWIFVMLANLLHVVFVATLAYRYLAVAPEVPPPAPRRR